jgi:hypothetical protein
MRTAVRNGLLATIGVIGVAALSLDSPLAPEEPRVVVRRVTPQELGPLPDSLMHDLYQDIQSSVNAPADTVPENAEAAKYFPWIVLGSKLPGDAFSARLNVCPGVDIRAIGIVDPRSRDDLYTLIVQKTLPNGSPTVTFIYDDRAATGYSIRQGRIAGRASGSHKALGELSMPDCLQPKSLTG